MSHCLFCLVFYSDLKTGLRRELQVETWNVGFHGGVALEARLCQDVPEAALLSILAKY